MKRIKVLGTSAVAVVVFGVMFLAGAQAATYKTCVEQKKGEYTDSNCATKSAKAKRGRFELVPVSTCVAQQDGEYSDASCTTKAAKVKEGSFEKASKLKFSASSGPAVLETESLGASNIECSASTSVGELTGPKTATWQTHYTGCKFIGVPCNSGGPDGNIAPPENVITNKAEATLRGPGENAGGPEGKIVPAGQVWSEFISIEHTPYLEERECPGFDASRLSGTLAGNETIVNDLGLTSNLTFSGTEGESGLITEVASTSAGPWSGPHHSIQNQSSTITFEKAVEVSES